jgi:uncharacterized protein (TIGR02391 family)
VKVAKSQLQNGMFWPDGVVQCNIGTIYRRAPFRGHETEAQQVLAEAWNWLEVNSLIVPAPDTNGASGFKVLSRRGNELADQNDVGSFRQAAAFPKALLHPAIADRIWPKLNRGDYTDAVRDAFLAVEEAVRAAGKYTLDDYGVTLMRKAFDKASGPLTEKSEPEGEREALSHLFAGAIGRYKNPPSHRTVDLEQQWAREECLLASHLLRIVDARK